MAGVWLCLPTEPNPVPVTNLFDDEGDGVDTWEEAATFVAGPLHDGQWYCGICAEHRIAAVTAASKPH